MTDRIIEFKAANGDKIASINLYPSGGGISIELRHGSTAVKRKEIDKTPGKIAALFAGFTTADNDKAFEKNIRDTVNKFSIIATKFVSDYEAQLKKDKDEKTSGEEKFASILKLATDIAAEHQQYVDSEPYKPAKSNLPPTSVEYASRTPDDYYHMLVGMGMALNTIFDCFSIEDLDKIEVEIQKISQRARMIKSERRTMIEGKKS